MPRSLEDYFGKMSKDREALASDLKPIYTPVRDKDCINTQYL